MDLNIDEWSEFRLDQLFSIICKGKCSDASSLIDGEGINYIGAKFNDNGVIKQCSKSENSDLISEGNCICMIGQGEGSAGYAIYLDTNFVGASSLNLGYADWINAYTGLFVSAILCLEYDKYCHGRSWTGKRLKKTTIKLPVNSIGDPDWQFMEDYIKSLNHKPLTTFNNNSGGGLSSLIFGVKKWSEFRLGDLIDEPYKAIAFNKDELCSEFPTDLNYITRTSENNGCELVVNRIDICCESIEKGNAITVGDTTGTCFYQPVEFICGDHMVIVRAKWLNQFTGLFVISLLNLEKYKYPPHGRAFLKDRISNTYLNLPIKYNSDETPYVDPTKKYSKAGYVPDWEFMENYIKSLPYGDRL